MTESRMVSIDDDGVPPSVRAEPEFFARQVPHSTIVGSSIMITQGQDGPVLGQLALLLFGDDQPYWAQRLTRALNNGAKAEKMIARLMGKPVRSTVPTTDVREFVRGLDRRQNGGKDGAAIRGDKGPTH